MHKNATMVKFLPSEIEKRTGKVFFREIGDGEFLKRLFGCNIYQNLL